MKTRAIVRALWASILALLLAACGESREAMLHSLERLEDYNVADTVMSPYTDEAEHIVKWADSHGTPNERLRAYYILGRAYADLGEAPAALDAYLKAAECADTTAADCDYKKLSRVHAQRANLYHKAIQPRSQLMEIDLAMRYADLAHDTVMYLECYSSKAGAYTLLHMPDSAITIREDAASRYSAIGRRELAALKIGGVIIPLIDKMELARAKRCIDTYETESGLFDVDGRIKKGKEVYYYAKGRYYLAIGKTDSAEYMFRWLAKDGRTWNDRIASSKGLQMVYEHNQLSDSIAKYASMAYDYNDSAYSVNEMETLQRMNAAYNYNRNKKRADEKELEAGRAKIVLTVVIAIVIVVLLLLSLAFILYRMKKKKDIYALNEALANLDYAQKELMELMAEKEEVSSTIIDELSNKVSALENDKKKSISYNDSLKEEIGNLQKLVAELSETAKSINNTNLEELIVTHTVVEELRKQTKKNPPEIASFKEMKEIRNLINQCIPHFYTTINNSSKPIRADEYDICVLVRAHFKPSEICKLTGKSEDYITNIRKRLLTKIYGITGSAKDFDTKVLNIR